MFDVYMKRMGRVALLSLLSVCIFMVWSMGMSKDGSVYAKAKLAKAKVVRVVDGDTLIAKIGKSSKQKRIRFIGVDTPESVAMDELANRNTPEGKTASNYTKKNLSGKTIYLKYDKDRKDRYGRTLAYVYTDKKGKKCFNAKLLKIGYARTFFVYPNYKYKSKFTKLERKAKSNKKGFWSAAHQYGACWDY